MEKPRLSRLLNGTESYGKFCRQVHLNRYGQENAVVRKLQYSSQQVNIRFYIDPTTGLPHIYHHDVDEKEVEEVLQKPGEDRTGREESRVAIGQTQAGRYLRVIYVPDPQPDSMFVVTAYELKGKPLTAYQRRQRRRGRR